MSLATTVAFVSWISFHNTVNIFTIVEYTEYQNSQAPWVSQYSLKTVLNKILPTILYLLIHPFGFIEGLLFISRLKGLRFCAWEQDLSENRMEEDQI